MKRMIIELPDEFATSYIQSEMVKAFSTEIADAISVGTVLPDDATNGEILKTIFPNFIDTEELYKSIVICELKDSEYRTGLPKDWLNSTYTR